MARSHKSSRLTNLAATFTLELGRHQVQAQEQEKLFEVCSDVAKRYFSNYEA